MSRAKASSAGRIRRARVTGVLRLAIVGWTFGYLLEAITIVAMGRMTLLVALVTAVPLLVLGVLLTMAMDRLRRSTSAFASGPVRRWAVLILSILAATAIQATADLLYLRGLAASVFPEWWEWASSFTPSRIFTVVILYLWTFCLMAALSWAARVNDLSHLHAARAASFEASAYKAESAMLRLQLNPHFLFNALNSIAGLVAADRKADADAMICRLGTFLRQSLAADPAALVSLEEEIESVEAYLSIEQARFEERLQIDIDLPDELCDAAVPNFILQPLVENAVLHGGGADALIAVRCRRDSMRLILSVENRNLSQGMTDYAERLKSKRRRGGIGLQNTSQRLYVAYGRNAQLRTEPLADGFRATITLPYEILEQSSEVVKVIA